MQVWRLHGRGLFSKDRTIAGNVVMPFFTVDYEGFDVNNEYDWQLAEHLVQKGDAKLPEQHTLTKYSSKR